MIPFGPFMLRRRLAVGGMAEVFLATPRERPQHALVVKRLLPHLEHRAEFLQMFVDEARLTATLRHPNIVRIERAGRADGLHYIALEYIDGPPLSRLLASTPRQPLPLPLGCWIVAQACRALAYAHGLTDESGRSLRVVHRDVSPDNILIASDGTVKLTDFGIAHTKMRTRLSRTRPGQRKGKLGYMSPEQMVGAEVDPRSDVFSLGSVLYEVTTGHRAFTGPSEGHVLQALVQARYMPPTDLVADFPPAILTVLTRAMAREPSDRYPNADALLQALLALIPDRHRPAEELARLVAPLSERAESALANRGPITKRETAQLQGTSSRRQSNATEAASGIGSRSATAARQTAAPIDATAPLISLDPARRTGNRPTPTNATAAYASPRATLLAYVPAGAEEVGDDVQTASYVAATPSTPELECCRPTHEMAPAQFLPLHQRRRGPLGWLIIGLLVLGSALALVFLYRGGS